MKRTAWISLVSLTALALTSAGCSQGDGKTHSQQPQQTQQPSAAPAKQAPPKDDQINGGKPITLKVYNWGVFSDEEYQKLIVEPLKKKYPNVTLDMIVRDSKTGPEQLAASGTDLDIYAIQSGQIIDFTTYNLIDDVTPLLSKNNISLDKFKPQYIDISRGRTKDKLWGIPFGAGGSTPWALIYNKDIFDKFGIPYPKDGMLWDDVYELAKKLTRNDNGVQYKGLDYQNIQSLGAGLGVASVDPKTEKASVNTADWQKVLALGKIINDIPGNDLPVVNAAKTRERFMKDKTIAMFASPSLLTFIKEVTPIKDLNWDVAQYPSYPEKPNISNPEGGIRPLLSIGSNSKHKDDVIKLFDFLTTDEIQIEYSKMAGLTTLKNPEIQKVFATSVPGLSDKKISSAFKSQHSPYVDGTDYDNLADKVMSDKFEEVKKGKDINTMTREAEEAINKQIEAAKKK
ncbi:ABC transporter substrate-binding protein [Paenibacillus cremeus]|uniref:Extracellular solute-binding protein n=1 Tax=Paenibacillus cremeus TaxID=2163881 RepID=A0A559KBG5_9BACL|nr:extracellular solute-binding protein [Paenibacillus cremeus]TVY09461.1 extracellular solute-binding protein [Paenibacillus cremeus]